MRHPRHSKHRSTLEFGLLAIVALGACAEVRTDPAEPTNRLIFDANRWVDRNGLQPVVLTSGSDLEVPFLIGMVTPIGVVTKNSILLVQYAIMGIRDGGHSVRDALIDTCHKRARPIIMTTVAMIAGMTPVVAGLGSDASFLQSKALAVVGGLITSTALSLLVVPVVFSCVRSVGSRVAAYILPDGQTE